MSRKHDRKEMVQRKVIAILNDPMTIHYLTNRLVRRKPKWMPNTVWKYLLYLVIAPSTRQPQE